MIRSCVLVAVFQVTFGQVPPNKVKIPRDLKDLGIHHPYQQMIPQECWRRPQDIDLRKCCPTPPLYSDDVMDRCGIEKTLENGTVVPSTEKKHKKAFCQDGTCLMKNANLLMANGSIDYEKLGTYVDQWAAANPEFTEIILTAKPRCAKEKNESWNKDESHKICDKDRVYLCFHSYMYWKCKPKEEFEECERLKEHMDECRPYYEKPKKRPNQDDEKDY